MIPQEKFKELELDYSSGELTSYIERIGAHLYADDFIAAKAAIETAFEAIEELKRDLISLERHVDAAKAVTR